MSDLNSGISKGTKVRRGKRAVSMPSNGIDEVQVIQSHLTASSSVRLDRQQLIEEAAYHRAEARGFAPGHEIDDWLAAETEVDARMGGEGRAY